MQKYKTVRAMWHKLRLRGKYYYKYKDHGVNMVSNHPIQDYYRLEKEWCKEYHRTCQSAFFTYDCKVPIWEYGKTFWEWKYGK